MNKQSRFQKLGLLTGLGLFFFGLPIAGVVFFWRDSQAKMQAGALKYARETVVPLMKRWDYEEVFGQVSVEGRKTVTAEAVAAYATKWGKLLDSSEPTATRTLVGEREDSAWQMTWVTVPARFERGEVKVRVKVAHRTTSTLWQVEALEVGG